jgi:hypothetical protein
MNTYSNFPLTHIWQSTNNPLFGWLVAPSRQVYTYQDWIGEPEEEIAAYAASELPAAQPAPEIDPDEFESEFNWFLS